MNAYKKKLNTSTCGLSLNDETQALNQWYAGVVDGADVRDRVAVTGFNISRGVFGSIGVDLHNEALEAALLEDSGRLLKS